MISSREDIKKALSDAGLKATHQRIVIYQATYKMNHHPTAEDIFKAIHKQNPSISMGTVYKTLETFVEENLLEKVFTREGHMRYETKTDNHGHIYCANTDEILDYYDSELDELIVQFFKKKRISNLHIKNITLQINANRIDPEKDISIK